jgi:transcriptional regulator with XRE-family HTH domain
VSTAEKIRVLRTQRGLTVADLSARSGLSKAHMEDAQHKDLPSTR